MPVIEARLKDLLDETRLAMLGTQLLMGLQYNAAFLLSALRKSPPGTPPARWSRAASHPHDGCLSTFLSPNCGGRPRHRPHAEASLRQFKIALLPLSLALGIDVAMGFLSSSVMGCGVGRNILRAGRTLPVVRAHKT
jgi:hypothetical protein